MDHSQLLPPLGLCVPCKLRYVIEADLMVFAVGQVELRVRLLHCFAPRRKGGTNPEAFLARDASRELVEGAKQLLLWIPAPRKIEKLLPLPEEVPGYVILDGGERLNDRLVEGGYCVRCA